MCLRGGRAAVLGVGGLPQFQGGGDRPGLAGPVHAFLVRAVGVGPLRQPCRSLPGLGGPPLEPGQFPHVGEVAFGGGLRGLGGAEPEVGDGQLFAGGAAGHRGGREDGLGEAGVAGRQVGQPHGVAGGLLHAVGVGEEGGVAFAHLGLGGAAAVGEALLDVGEAAGVEQPAEQPAAGLGVRPQETGEVPLGQQDDLAELLAAHAQQPGDLLAGLLVGAGEVLPNPGGGVVLAQPGLRLVDGRARAALLGPLPGRLPGDLQPPSGDGQVEAHLGAGGGAAWSLRRVRPWAVCRAPGTEP